MVKLLELIKFLRKREGEANFDSFFELPFLLLNNSCLNVNTLSESANRKQKFVYLAREIYFKTCIVGIYLGTISVAIHAVHEAKTFAETLSNIRDALAGTFAAITSSVIFYGKNEVLSFCEELKSFCNRRVTNPTLNVREHLDRYRRAERIYFACILSMVSTPLVLVTSYITTGRMFLTVHYWFPFDEHQAETFPIALAWFSWIAWICGMWYAASDLIGVAIATTIAMEFDFLANDVSKLEMVEDCERENTIRAIVDRHNELISLSDRFQKFYGISYLASFVTISLALSISTYLIATEKPDLVFYPFNFGYLLMLLGRTFFSCKSGQMIITASLAVADAAYNSSAWESSKNLKLKKWILMLMIRAQQPIRLTAMNFYDVSYETFISILSAAWSYLSVVRNLKP